MPRRIVVRRPFSAQILPVPKKIPLLWRAEAKDKIPPMRGLVLAAGRGERLSHRRIPKPLVQVLGTALIERVLTRLSLAGIDNLVVVVGYEGRMVTRLLDSVSEKLNMDIQPVFARDWRDGSASSFLSAQPHFDKPFLLSMGDHLHDPSCLRRLISGGLTGDAVRLAVDDSLPGEESELQEATKVWIEGDRLVYIGKEIHPYNAIDTGCFLCSPELFDAVEAGRRKGSATMSGGVGILGESRRAGIFHIGDAWWIDVDTEKDVRKAEKVLSDENS